MVDSGATDGTLEKLKPDYAATSPTEVTKLKKDDYVVLEGRPCKIVEITTVQSGEYGHFKVTITGLDIFTDMKYETTVDVPDTSTIEVPKVISKDYNLVTLCLTSDKPVVLLDDEGKVREDLKLPDDLASASMIDSLKFAFEEGEALIVTVLAAMGEEKIVSFRRNEIDSQ